MGTRALVHVKNERGQYLVTIYRQFDGYPDGLGRDLERLVGRVIIVNGYSPGQDWPTHANGMGCVAAGLVAGLKVDHGSRPQIGGVYLYPPGTSGVGEEYTYELSEHDGRVQVVVRDLEDVPLYAGPLAGLTQLW
jgi:hypothetical protein